MSSQPIKWNRLIEWVASIRNGSILNESNIAASESGDVSRFNCSLTRVVVLTRESDVEAYTIGSVCKVSVPCFPDFDLIIQFRAASHDSILNSILVSIVVDFLRE
jgi:hypothetical protein